MEHKEPIKQNLLIKVRQGLEREVVRTDLGGKLAATAHPKALGSPLTHPHITLDFAEAQLEFTTPPLRLENTILPTLEKLQSWTYRQLKNEFLWPLSTPPALPEHSKIPLANFGTSAAAGKKRVYREGLKRRYGGAMQTISGIHYNFSMTNDFWKNVHRISHSSVSLEDFKNDRYFALMRNAIRAAPLITYLFGASPAVHKSFFTEPPKDLIKITRDAYGSKYATSLRLSKYGYHNARRGQIAISYNSLEEYVRDLGHALSTPSALWSELGLYRGKRQLQLNANLLQLENEFYTAIRPKQKKYIVPGHSSLASLACAGVEYVELRIIDLDPFSPAGISIRGLNFLHAFMAFCLLHPSPRFKPGEQEQWEDSHRRVALDGRRPGLYLAVGAKKIKFSEWLTKTLKKVAETAKLLDIAYKTQRYSRVIAAEQVKIDRPETTPSARIIAALVDSKSTFVHFGLALAREHKRVFVAQNLNPAYCQKMKETAARSLTEQAKIEQRDAWVLSGFEGLELSTQVLIRAAQKRGIIASVLDESANLVELRKGTKCEVVKQATITRRDSYLSYELMNDKQLTKLFLEDAGIATPTGGQFTSRREALHFYRDYALHNALVVKPNTTNHGIGVSIVPPHEPKRFIEAMQRSFRSDKSILIEEFIPGKEYRFLVINNQVIGVLNREPANIIGDGKHTIQELVRRKNSDPQNYKLPAYYIRLGAIERKILEDAGVSLTSIPRHGQKIYLRKNSNVSNGGDPIDVTDRISAGYKNIALRAATAVGARVCGVDMIIKKPAARPDKTNYSVIELNWNPAIFMHAFPIKGKSRDVGGAILDFLKF